MPIRTLIIVIAICFISGIQTFAFERSSRLYALNELDVQKNVAVLLRVNKCVGCYLANAQLSGMDLSYADLRKANLIGVTFIRATLTGANLKGAKLAGANFSGAQWVDGSICLVGSVGRCIKSQPE
ncbi:pentapeptide repeat-containing protein [bacterium]|nr:pentapeptide repeat-containing protein [bacterium]